MSQTPGQGLVNTHRGDVRKARKPHDLCRGHCGPYCCLWALNTKALRGHFHIYCSQLNCSWSEPSWEAGQSPGNDGTSARWVTTAPRGTLYPGTFVT